MSAAVEYLIESRARSILAPLAAYVDGSKRSQDIRCPACDGSGRITVDAVDLDLPRGHGVDLDYLMELVEAGLAARGEV